MALALALVCGGLAIAQTASDYNAEGVKLYGRKQWDQALEYFLAAYELAPDNPTVRRNLCHSYQAIANDLVKSNDYRTAVQLLQNAISVDPQNAGPLVQLGSYYLRQDLSQEAAFRLEEAVELAPDNADAYDLLCDAYYKMNELAAALAQW